VGTPAEEIRVVGPKAVVITANFHYTKADSAGKPDRVTGVWSGVLDVEGGTRSCLGGSGGGLPIHCLRQCDRARVRECGGSQRATAHEATSEWEAA
jgi:hypothetical protein